ncbi:hypothetical protein [Vreelandella nanhaiensis]|uniref:Uncharacterized protein n=1 Tax=Vreelandella nanhaiensis TaxID=1258546 RepID=A0A3S0Y7M8_9GAMM|nr:hypothetical protein [Halomonas nanhaiensis]RUR34477.1 hypothetical protein ELY38_02485 [Halomonas nanhaiensis]
MPNAGGRYEIRDGKRELVHRTKPSPVQPAKAVQSQFAAAPVKTDTAAPKPTTPVAKQEVKVNE